MNEKFAQMSASMEQGNEKLEQLHSKLEILDVRVQNEQVRSFNRPILQALEESTMDLRKLVKEHVGIGEDLPGNFPRLEEPAEFDIGSSPPSRFPKDKCELHTLTHGQLDYLSRFYNHTFNITPDLSLARRREKLGRYISYR